MHELRDVRSLFMPQGAELQHEVRYLEDHGGNPLVRGIGLGVQGTT